MEKKHPDVLVYHNGIQSIWETAVMSMAAGVKQVRPDYRVFYKFAGGYDIPEARPGDYVVTIGFNERILKLIHDSLRTKVNVLILTDGFIKTRDVEFDDRHWAVGLNGIHCQAEQPPFLVPGDRWRKLDTALTPWRKRTSKDAPILIAHQYSQHPLNGVMKVDLFQNAVQEIRQYTNRPIIVKQHPLDKTVREFPGATEVIRGRERNFSKYLAAAHCVITGDSNAGLESILAGVPVFTLMPSMLDSVANKDLSRIENPETPDRQQWANWIAYTQWTAPEMKTGEAWKAVIEHDIPLLQEPETEKVKTGIAFTEPVAHVVEMEPETVPDPVAKAVEIETEVRKPKRSSKRGVKRYSNGGR